MVLRAGLGGHRANWGQRLDCLGAGAQPPHAASGEPGCHNLMRSASGDQRWVLGSPGLFTAVGLCHSCPSFQRGEGADVAHPCSGQHGSLCGPGSPLPQEGKALSSSTLQGSGFSHGFWLGPFLLPLLEEEPWAGADLCEKGKPSPAARHLARKSFLHLVSHYTVLLAPLFPGQRGVWNCEPGLGMWGLHRQASGAAVPPLGMSKQGVGQGRGRGSRAGP